MTNWRLSVGSICSGIEAASVAWDKFGFEFDWFSEISQFPSRVLKEKYPKVDNLGDMQNISNLLQAGEISAPDLICGGTPCQSFSVAGWKKGLSDNRGNLTLEFVKIADANDVLRKKKGKSQTLLFWENVEGVLRDRTNAFGCLLSSLLGIENEIKPKGKWPSAGVARGPHRNVAWRVLDAKYFGIPHQRRRLYLVAGGADFSPEDVLFELHDQIETPGYPSGAVEFKKDGHDFLLFRSYTDCLYSAYGTKWNGNAAAYNGSLFVCQNDRIRRLTPLECERLMGFPDNYTSVDKVRPTARYQSLGNSWSVPVVQWLGEKISKQLGRNSRPEAISIPDDRLIYSGWGAEVFGLGSDPFWISSGLYLNSSAAPSKPLIGDMRNIVETQAEEKFYLTPVGCKGILRRAVERNVRINPVLEKKLSNIASTWTDEEIEKISRIQPRGSFSRTNE